MNQREVRSTLQHNLNTKTNSRSDQWFGQCWFYSFKRQLFSSRGFVVCVWRQRSSYQDDFSREGNPTMRHVSRTHQSCSWLVVRSNQSGFENPNQVHWHQKPTSQTHWPREISHVMNRIIFCVCLTLAISVLPIVLKWCRKERNKMQVKKESQQNRSQWWIQSRDAAKGLLTCLLLLHQKALGKPDMKVNYFWGHGMSSIKEQGDLWWAVTHQVTHSGMLTRIGLLKSGNMMNWLK